MSAVACQRDFAAALLAPAMATPAGIVAGRSRTDAVHRFAIHRNTFVAGLIDALAETFPVTQALVGDDFFRALARERVLADPPRSPVLLEYAEGFADFIARFEPAACVTYLADVARIEALRVRAHHAADAAPLAEAAYHALIADPQRLAASRVELHPACHWLSSRHAAYSIWRAHQGLAAMADACLDRIDPDVAQDVLVCRPMLEVEVSVLPAGAVAFLDALRRGRTLAEAFDAAHAACADVDIGALFALLIGHGLLVGTDPTPDH